MKNRLGAFFILVCLLLPGCNGSDKTAEQIRDSAQTLENIQGAELTEEPIHIAAEPITLQVYSQLGSFWGEQQGWFAKVLLDKFNVKLYYMTENDAVAPEAVSDLIIWGSKNGYLEAAEEGLLLDWEADGLLAERGAYIAEHMAAALEYNRGLTEQGKIFGLGNNIVPDKNVCEDFFLTWDIRYDLYKELGYPEIKNLEDLEDVLGKMQALCPTNDAGEAVYALSLWPDWDAGMLMTAKCLATAYYGYDEHHLGLYDTRTGTFHGALEKNGPYLEMLQFLNSLYRQGLLDPESHAQTYDDVVRKTAEGSVLFSLFNYAGSAVYNTEEHLADNKYMTSLVPAQATPAAYGLSVYGNSNRIWTIGAGTEHAALVMEIINWLCTPEGRLTYEYGPKGVTWDYDAEGYMYLTELGKTCMEDRTTAMTGEYEGCFNDGCPVLNAVTWYYLSPNPEANEEPYDYCRWKSNLPAATCGMEQDWREFTKASTVDEYIKNGNYVVIPEVNYEATAKSSELEAAWEQVAECIERGSWQAVCAESEEEFQQVIDSMQAEVYELGYEKCMTWCEYEAMRRRKLEEELPK